MATTTPNFGWAVPTSTDLVKDGAVAIETLGDSIDASLVDLKGGTTGQVLAKASGTDMDFTWTTSSAGMTNPMTTTGDTIYSSSGSTPARLGIGSTGNVLTVAGGVPSWAAPASSSQNFSLLNAGGTSLSGTRITVSGISAKGTILVVVVGGGVTVSGSTVWKFEINGDTATNYNYAYTELSSPAAYAASSLTSFSGYGDDSINGGTSNGASARWSGAMTLSGCNSAGVKTFIFNGSGNATSNSQKAIWGQGHYNSASTISSVSIYANGNTMNAGKIYVYASA
jgi:hypothetical protein